MNSSDCPEKDRPKPRAERTWNELYGRQGVVQQQVSPNVKHVAALFKRHGVRRVLDLGCGTGRHARLLVNGGFEVYGCDASKDAVAITRIRIPEATFQEAQMGALPYEDSFFDGILCYHVIQHAEISEIRAAVAEIERVLQPNGILFLGVPSTKHPEGNTGREIESGTRIGINAIDGDMPHHYFTREELERLFRGFEIIFLKHQYHPSEKDAGRPAASWLLVAKRSHSSLQTE